MKFSLYILHTEMLDQWSRNNESISRYFMIIAYAQIARAFFTDNFAFYDISQQDFSRGS